MICNNCGGRRVIQGFGGIRKDCEACGATGRIADKSLKGDKRSREYRELKKQQEA